LSILDLCGGAEFDILFIVVGIDEFYGDGCLWKRVQIYSFDESFKAVKRIMIDLEDSR
jgi:hypothetical protein